MARQIEAVYENGVLRPLEPLSLPEHERLTITLPDPDDDPLASLIDQEFFKTAAEHVRNGKRVPTLEEVRTMLSKLPGSLSADIISEREDRI